MFVSGVNVCGVNLDLEEVVGSGGQLVRVTKEEEEEEEEEEEADFD